MRAALFVLLAILPAACAVFASREEIPHFAVTPFGEPMEATRIRPQEGDDLGAQIKFSTFREATIAQGSGFDGFDAVRIFKSGEGYAVFNTNGSRNRKLALVLSRQEVQALITALNRDRISQIAGGYSSDLNDGVQGFIEVVTDSGRRYAWLDNHFDPVANTYAYCNKVIWRAPSIRSSRAWTSRGIDRQAEYYRVFGRR